MNLRSREIETDVQWADYGPCGSRPREIERFHGPTVDHVDVDHVKRGSRDA